MARVLHPELTAAKRRRLVRTGIDCFNSGRFFDAHEAWEEVWRSTTPEPKELWRGLIQVAVGLYHHLERGNPAAARRVLARGLRRLEPFPQGTEGLDLDLFRAAAHAWQGWLGEPVGDPPPLPRVEPVPGRPSILSRTMTGPTEDDLQPYEVWAHDAFHLDGDAERYRVGGFADCASAREACANVVADFLQSRFREGMSAEELFALYQGEGADPFIESDDPDCIFAAADYARRLAAELCG